MAISMGWLIEDHVLYLKLSGKISLGELENAIENLLILIDQSPTSPIHVFSDLSDMDSIPLDLHGLANVSIKLVNNPKMGWSVMIKTHQSFFEQIVNLVGRIARADYHFVDSLDEGIAFLAEHDDTLPDPIQLTPSNDVAHILDATVTDID